MCEMEFRGLVYLRNLSLMRLTYMDTSSCSPATGFPLCSRVEQSLFLREGTILTQWVCSAQCHLGLCAGCHSFALRGLSSSTSNLLFALPAGICGSYSQLFLIFGFCLGELGKKQKGEKWLNSRYLFTNSTFLCSYFRLVGSFNIKSTLL